MLIRDPRVLIFMRNMKWEKQTKTIISQTLIFAMRLFLKTSQTFIFVNMGKICKTRKN